MKTYFSEALFMHLPKYTQKSQKAFRQKDYERAEQLFDSLTKHQLAGSYMDDFKFKKLNKKEVSIYDFKKPVYLMTHASWRVPTEGEIPAINELARKYSNNIDFVILLWDSREAAKNLAKEYDKKITVVYIDEKENHDAFVIKNLKHSLGLPTCFLLDGTKQIVHITRNPEHPYQTSAEESFRINYESLQEGISIHLINEEAQSNTSEMELVALPN